jgi:hypothetical protein
LTFFHKELKTRLATNKQKLLRRVIMKVLVIIASALFAFTASAGEFSGFSMSKKGYVVYEQIYFQKASAWLRANEVCRDGNVLTGKTLSSFDVTYCDESGSGSKSNCKVVSKPAIQPVVSTYNRCKAYGTGSDDDKCVGGWEKVTLNQATADIYFYESAKKYEDDIFGYNSKTTFSIPACATGGGAAN